MENQEKGCEQIENIVSLKKDVESHDKRIGVIETKQTRQDDYIGEMKEFRSVQMETNKYLSEIISQNVKLIQKIDTKYEKDVSETKEKIHTLEIAMINENIKQDKGYDKDKMTIILKVVGWTVGIIGTMAGVIWKFVVK